MIKYNLPKYAQMPAEGDPKTPQETRVLSPAKGLNELGDDFMIDNKEASSLLNIMFTENGVVEKRYGYTTIAGALTNVPKGLTLYRGTTTHLFCVDGTTLKKLNDNDVWEDASCGLSVIGSTVYMNSCRGKLFVWDGVGQTGSGGCVFYDDTAATPAQSGTRCPKARFAVSYKSRQVCAGVDGQPARLFLSRIAHPEVFTRALSESDVSDLPHPTDSTQVPGATVFEGESNSTCAACIDVNKEDGEAITGLGFFQDSLIIFKEHSIWQGVFNSDGQLAISRITNAYGCIAHGSICTVENDCYFLSNDGIYVLGNEPNYYTAIRTNQLSARIVGLMNRLEYSARLGIRSVYHDHRYHICVPLDGSDVNNFIVTYDKRFYAWSVWDIAASGITAFDDVSGRYRLAFTSSKDKKTCVFVRYQYHDDGKPIEAYWQSRAFHGKKIDYTKLWKVFRPILKRLKGSITIAYYDDNGEFGSVDDYQFAPKALGGLDTELFSCSTLGLSESTSFSEREGQVIYTGDSNEKNNSNNAAILNIYIGRQSRTFGFRIYNNKINENFALLGFVIQYQNMDFNVFDGSDTYLNSNSGLFS